MTLTINGIDFEVGTIDLKRNWVIEEKYNVTVASGKRFREVKGIYKNYALTLRNINDTVYNSLIAALTAKQDSCNVTLPYGNNSTLTFEAFFDNISDSLVKTVNGTHHWDNLTVNFKAANSEV